MKRILFTFCFILITYAVNADIKLPAVIADGMVLQQNTVVKIWGWGNPGEKVTMEAGWLKTPLNAVTGKNGSWMFKVKTVSAGGPYKIIIKGNNEIVLNDILLGEVWICSGQSNMEFTIKMLGGWNSHYKADKEDFINNDYSKIRFCQLEKATSPVPLDTCKAKWIIPDTTAVENFSATAFFFGRELYNKLKVPIGLISTNWGGTPAEAWTEKSYLEKDPELNYYLSINSSGEASHPAKLFNAMINPLLNYTIKGVIWYQGEANVDNSNLYSRLFTAMIKCWRDKWQLGDFPFYYVQIAPYNYNDRFNSSAYLREAQLQTLSKVKNCGMAVTMDIGNPADIHPVNKQEVGRRLAKWAFAKTYGFKDEPFSGPIYRKYKIEGNKIRLYFDYTGGGLEYRGKKLTGFSVAGKDMKFADAEAVIDKNTILVSSAGIAKPAAVRFAFTNIDSVNLFNKEGLPASSFRTDILPFYKPALKVVPSTDIAGGFLNAQLKCADAKAVIRYTTNGATPDNNSPLYNHPLKFDKSTTLKLKAYNNKVESLNMVEFSFTRHTGFGKEVIYKNTYSPKYPSAKEFALTDGIRGSSSFNDGYWQGFQQVDFEALIDLKETKIISSISIGFLKAVGSWIFPPKLIEFYVSEDGINFTKTSAISNSIPSKTGISVPETYTSAFKPVNARYIKISAVNIGTCPAWHPGKGGKAWLFADEIIIE